MQSDLKILVGSIIPHGAAGFSGGSKLLFPGVASFASAEAYHRGTCSRGRYAVVETDARLESDEAARLAGVDFLVNAIPNSRLGIAGLVTGDVVAAHREGCEIARRVYTTQTRPGADVCVLSVYPKDAEFLQYLTAFAPWQTAPAPLVREGGTVVVALDGSEGPRQPLALRTGHAPRPRSRAAREGPGARVLRTGHRPGRAPACRARGSRAVQDLAGDARLAGGQTWSTGQGLGLPLRHDPARRGTAIAY